MRTLLGCATLIAFGVMLAACGDGQQGVTAPTIPNATSSSTLQPTTAPTELPRTKVGHVESTSPITRVTHGSGGVSLEVGPNDPLFAGDALATNRDGGVDFKTDDVELCISQPNTQVRVRPNETLALEWFGSQGTTSCVVRRGETARTFGVNHEATLRVTGTVFQVTLAGLASIGVLEGSVEVTLGGRTTSVGPRQQLILPTGTLQPWRPAAEDLTDLTKLMDISRELALDRSIDVMDVQPGECFHLPEETTLQDVEVVTVSPCSGDYYVELTKWQPVEGSEYPGSDFLDAVAADSCPGSYLIPTQDRWDQLGFTQIGCFTLHVPPIF